jgi:hypothetical protein
VARICQGAKTAVQLGTRFDRESTDADRVAAAIFSRTIREYSAGEHFPRAIICPRRPIVSQEANAISIIIKGTEVGFLRIRFFIPNQWSNAAGQQATNRAPRITRHHFCGTGGPYRSGSALAGHYSAALIDAVNGRVSVDGCCIPTWPRDPSMPLMSLLLISISLLISLR